MVKKHSLVTVVDNETGKEITGVIVEYTPNRIILRTQVMFDAKKVHFKEVK